MQARFLLSCFLLICAAQRHYTERGLELIEKQQRGRLAHGDAEAFDRIVREGLRSDLAPIVKRCREHGCRDMLCCTNRLDTRFRDNALAMEVMREQWLALNTAKEEL